MIQKNKIILVLTLGMMLSPILALQAAGATNTTKANTHTQNNTQPNTIENKNAIKVTPAELEALKAQLMKGTDAFKKDLDAKKITLGQQISADKTAAKIKLTAKAQEKVISALDSIYTKLNTQIEKLSQVDIKILNKIDTAESKGSNVVQAKAQYTIAKAAIDKATADIIASRTVAVDQTNTATSKEALRTLVKSSQDSIQVAGDESRKLLSLISGTTQNANGVETTAKPVTSTK